ncbi:MAG: DUF6599 family protein [Polyangiaceae bacterium]
MSFRAIATAVSLLLVTACGDKSQGAGPEKRGSAPPTSKASGSAGAGFTCSRAAFDDAEAKTFLPSNFSGFCVDPEDGGKTFGEGSQTAIERIADVFDGESRIYEDHKVKKVVQARYVADTGAPVSVNIVASRFDSSLLAYAMFTKRVVGDSDPADPSTPTATPGGGAAFLGAGNAYLWRDRWLLELVYQDDAAAPDVLEATSRKVLAPLVKTIGDRIPGDAELPKTVARLPKDHVLAAGRRFAVAGAIPGMPDSPGGAIGYYANGKQRYRVVVSDQSDGAKAKAAFKALGGTEGAVLVKTSKDGTAELQWVALVKDSTLFIVMDEPRVLLGVAANERAGLTLPESEKRKLVEALSSEKSG